MKRRQSRTNQSDDNLLSAGIRKINEVVDGSLSAEKYLNSKSSSDGRLFLKAPELTRVKTTIETYWKFLLKFTGEQRRVLICRPAIIGFSLRDLRDLYGIHNDTMGKFLGRGPKSKSKSKKSKPLIRDALKGPVSLNKQVVAMIAILSRLTEDMLVNDVPALDWNNDYFNYFAEDCNWSLAKFLEVIELSLAIQPKYRDVMPAILKINRKTILYLRVEAINGSVIVELMNKDCTLNECKELLKILAAYEKCTGYVQTIVPWQKNYTIVVGNNVDKCPVEFVPDVLI